MGQLPPMIGKRRVEIFGAGCEICQRTIEPPWW
jgi:hypothetical protein